MSRTAKNLGYWSEQHRKLLYSRANRTIKKYARRRYVTVGDLMHDAWLRSLQNRDEQHLRGTASIIDLQMHESFWYAATGQTKYERRTHPVTKQALPYDRPIEQFDCMVTEDWRQQAIDDADDYTRIYWEPARKCAHMVERGIPFAVACRSLGISRSTMQTYLRRVFAPVVEGMHRRSK